MIVGDFEFHVSDGWKAATMTPDEDRPRTVTIRKKHECFDLEVEDIYHLEFIIQEIKRNLNLK